MKAIEEGPRCAPPAEACPAVREQFTGGGDRLAAYLITQFEASESEGYPGAYLFLRFIAYTESATAFDYFAERLRRRDALTRKELRNTVLALGHVANPRAIDEVIPLFAEYPDPGLRADVVRAVVRTMARSGARPPRSVAFLRNLQTDPGYRDYVTRELDRLGLRRRD